MTWRIEQGHVLDVLREMKPESVNCVVTSPPYWGLRAYGTEPQVWSAVNDCVHEWGAAPYSPKKDGGHQFVDGGLAKLAALQGVPYSAPSDLCIHCGAWRGELGSEPTIALFIEHLIQIFDEVRRVLRADGTCWVNLGDSYAGSGKGPSNSLQPDASQIGSPRKNQGPRTGAYWAGSRVGDTVLDPFVGSGTTLFVAEENGRNSTGIELNPAYIKLAEKRMRGARTPLPGLFT